MSKYTATAATITQSEPAPKWTQSEAIAFECAREVIGDLMAIQTGQIAEEKERESRWNTH